MAATVYSYSWSNTPVVASEESSCVFIQWKHPSCNDRAGRVVLWRPHLMNLIKSHFQALNRELSLNTLEPVLCPRASHLIAAYDEHVLVSQYKFGILYQRFGQTSEEELFGNRNSSPAFDEFLKCLGQRINLKFHKGWVFSTFEIS